MKGIVFAALAALCLTMVSALELEDSNSSSNYTYPANSSSPCFILRGVVQYSVHRLTPGGEVWEGTFHDDSDDAIVAGSCGAPDPNVKGQLVSSLTIGNTISEHYVELEMQFLQNQSTKSWKGGEFVLRFPENGKSWTEDAETGSVGSADSLSSTSDQGVKCSQANISINGTSGKGLIMLSNFTIYPGFVNVTSPVVTCPYDQSPATSNVVPIAVGCALAGLVLIVLVAYLIGRTRHERQHKGYQSV